MTRFLGAALVWLCLLLPAHAERAIVCGPTNPDGTEVVCDLPVSVWKKNVGGRDGAGLCVFTSINHAGFWQNEEALFDFQNRMRSELGGGYPSKVDVMMKKYAPGVKYVQYEGNDPAILDLAMKTGRMVSVTYGYSERYGGRVAHMVNLVHLDDKWGCVLDNNFIGADRLEWMSRAEFLRRWKLGGGGWAVVLLNPPPPPVPIHTTRPVMLALASWGPMGCGPVGPPDNDALKAWYGDQKRNTEWTMQRIWSRTRKTRLPEEEAVHVSSVVPPLDAAKIGVGYDWRFRSDDRAAYLYKDGVQIGAWDGDGKRWMDFDAQAGTWQDGYPPWYAPALVGAQAPPSGVFFGVERDKIGREESLSLNGKRVAFRVIQDVFGDDTLSDDSGRLRLTVCGLKDVRDRVVADMKTHPALASMSNRFLVQSYPPGTWATEVFKRPAGEAFWLSISGPPNKKSQGVEYHAQTSYDGPERLAKAMEEALRRSDPNYDPTKTPDLTKPKPPPVPPAPVPAPEPAGFPSWWLIVGLLVALLIGGKRNEHSS